jgi:hypothetical protein
MVKGIAVQSLNNIPYLHYEREDEGMLQKAKGMVVVGSVVAMVVVLVSGMAFAGETVSLVGEINDDFQIITDNGEAYEVMMSGQGIDLIDHAGERVRVIGEIIDDGEGRLIDVASFEVLSPATEEEDEEEEEEEEEPVETSDKEPVQEKQ